MRKLSVHTVVSQATSQFPMAIIGKSLAIWNHTQKNWQPPACSCLLHSGGAGKYEYRDGTPIVKKPVLIQCRIDTGFYSIILPTVGRGPTLSAFFSVPQKTAG